MENFEYKDDEIFLMSTDEYKQLSKNIPSISSWWWLRTPGLDNNSIMLVYDDNSINFNGLFINRAYSAIRPVLYLKDKHNIGDIIIKYKFPWVVVADNLAIAEVPIGFQKFDNSCNDYKNSYIRQWLKKWKEART